jgi:cell division protein FtsN
MPIPLWIWLFAAVFIGSFVGLLYYLDLYDKGKIGTDHQENIKQLLSAPALSEQKENQHSPVVKQDKKTKDTAAKFDFYSILPSMEVIIPEREIAVQDKDVPKQPGPKSKTPYILQAGSFKDPQQADRLKAGLALMGIESAIETVTIKDSGVWHRVRVGPFTNMREITRVRSRMRANKIEPILLRDKI